jgi:exodeoxyribonuclease VII large subunit
MIQCGARIIELSRARLAAAAGRLPRLTDLLAIATQRLDLAAGRLGAALAANLAAHRQDLTAKAAALKPRLLTGTIEVKRQTLNALARRLEPLARRSLAQSAERLAALDKLRLSLDPDRPLSRGFARITRPNGRLVRSAAGLKRGEAVTLVFHDGDRAAVIDAAAPPRRGSPTPAGADQGRLFRDEN